MSNVTLPKQPTTQGSGDAQRERGQALPGFAGFEADRDVRSRSRSDVVKVSIIPSGGANLQSLEAALQRLGATCIVTADPEIIRTADKVILPGVGAAGDAMARLQDLALVELLRSLQQPVLGICLGMQLLYEFSEEGGHVPCLGLLPGTVRRIPDARDYPVPHMGWNNLRWGASRLLSDTASCYYFTHSYYCPDGQATTAWADYSLPIPSVVEHGNIYGVQFHPEKSSEAGARLLERFLAL